MKEKQLLMLGVLAAAVFYLLRRTGSGVLPSSPLRLSDGSPLPLTGLIPYHGGDASVPNVAADRARVNNSPTFGGWIDPGSQKYPTWGVPIVGGLPQVGLIAAPETNANLIQQAIDESDSGDVVLTPMGFIDLADSPSIARDNVRGVPLGFAPTLFAPTLNTDAADDLAVSFAPTLFAPTL